MTEGLKEISAKVLIEAVPDPVMVLDSRGLIVAQNAACRKLFGYALRDIAGKHLLDCGLASTYSLKEMRSAKRNFSDAIKEDKGFALEYEFVTKKGRSVHVLLSGSTLKDVEKKTTHIIVLLKDLTERKRAEEAVHQSEKQLNQIFNATADGMRVVDKDFNVIRMNDTLASMVGVSIEDAIELKCHDVFSSALCHTANCPLTRILRGEERVTMDIDKETPAGVMIPCIMSATPFKDSRGAVIGIVEAFRNITERKNAEKALLQLTEELDQRVKKRTQELAAANQELEAFAYSVSHDLRSPPRGIAGFSMAVLEDYSDVLDETGRDYLKRTHEGAVRMSELIADILSLSRVSREEMHSEEIDMTALARTIAGELRRQEPRRDVKLAISDNLRAYGDKRLISLVLENLLGNAWKFTSKHPSAKIEFGAIEQETETVFFVRDNGAGFDMRYVDKMFIAFQRLHHADEFEGTGVGLAIVKRIIRRHGGRTWAEGSVGTGATFHFTLSSKGSEVLT